MYDYKFLADENIWELWTESAKNFQVDAKASFSKAVIPTNDNIRMHYLMKTLLCKLEYHVLCPGPTGTGKSVNAMKLLTSDLPDTHQYITLTFSAQTDANQTQDTIDGKLVKRRRGIYGLAYNKKCILMVDDMNMPKKDEYLSQPPIEILR